MSFDKEIVVDLKKFNRIEFGIKKEDQLRAKSRQFTKDLDVIGQIYEKGKNKGYVGFRENPWKEDIPNKHVVFKTFTKGISWKASMEQLVAKSLMQSMAADRAMPVFMINIAKSDYLITLEKTHRKPVVGKSIYAFNIVDDKTLEVQTYAIETDRMSFGSDWFVYDNQREKVAAIDGAKFNIGGKYTIKLNTQLPSHNTIMEQVLILFAALLNYLSDVEKYLKKSVKAIKKKGAVAVVSREEAQLYINPRRIKM